MAFIAPLLSSGLCTAPYDVSKPYSNPSSVIIPTLLTRKQRPGVSNMLEATKSPAWLLGYVTLLSHCSGHISFLSTASGTLQGPTPAPHSRLPSLPTFGTPGTQSRLLLPPVRLMAQSSLSWHTLFFYIKLSPISAPPQSFSPPSVSGSLP